MKRSYFILGVLGLVAFTLMLALIGVIDPMAPHSVGMYAAETGAVISPEMIEKIAKQIDELTKRVDKQLGEATEGVKQLGTELTTKTAAGEKITEGLKENVDKVLKEQGDLRTVIEELKAKGADIEQALAARKKDAERPDSEKSPGELFIEDKKVKDFLADSKNRGRVRIDVKTITTAAMTGLVAPQRVGGIVALPERRMTVRDLLTPGRTNSNAIQYWQETGFTNNASAVSEGTTKPESTIAGELITANVTTIAHIMIAAKQIMDDAPALQSQIDGRLRYGLAYEEEQEILLGDGSGTQLLGIIPQASPFSAEFQPEFQQRIDAIRLAFLQAELALFPASGAVVHPTDWARIELTKDNEGRYIFANPQAEAQPRLWGRPIVSTPAMTEGRFLAGAFKLGAQIFDREDANVELSTEDSDNFRKNLITLRAEERLALAVYRPEAFIEGAFQTTT